MAWSTRFADRDRVEWVGPDDLKDSSVPSPGERGTVVSIDPPDEWVVAWDITNETAVYPEAYLRKVTVWSTSFPEGDRVEWTGTSYEWQVGAPRRGERGIVLRLDPPDMWVVQWEKAATQSCLERDLEPLTDDAEGK